METKHEKYLYVIQDHKFLRLTKQPYIVRAKLLESYIVSQGMHLRPKRWKAFDDSSGTHSEDSG